MVLMILAAVSGTGKSTVVAELCKRCPNLKLSVSHTTRKPRPGEVDGVQYNFVTREQFDAKVAEDGFAEWAEYAGNCYGTSISTIEEAKAKGHDLLFEIDCVGAMNIMRRYPEAISCFLLPPSMEELENRLRGRGTESEETIQRRLAIGQQEMKTAEHFQHFVVNHTVEQAASDLQRIYTDFAKNRSEGLALIQNLQATRD